MSGISLQGHGDLPKILGRKCMQEFPIVLFYIYDPSVKGGVTELLSIHFRRFTRLPRTKENAALTEFSTGWVF